MGVGETKRSPRRSLNPNWSQLKEKLKSGRPEPPKPSIDSENRVLETVLGKRKGCPDSEPVPLVTELNPLSSDCSLTDTIAMDCEMVGVSSQGNKSALGRVSLVNAWGNAVYDEFVRPMERVVDYRSHISGIWPRNLRKAKDFQTVQKKVAELLKGRILVGHALRNDLKALLLTHPKQDTRDTVEYQPFMRTGGRKRALRDLASEFLGVKIQQKEHCSVEDARAAMLIYQKHKKEWERSVKQTCRFKGKHKKNKIRKNLREKDAGSKLASASPS